MTKIEYEAALAERDARIERLEAELKRLRPPPVPYPDGHTTVLLVKNRVVLPTRDELHRLEAACCVAGPFTLATAHVGRLIERLTITS